MFNRELNDGDGVLKFPRVDVYTYTCSESGRYAVTGSCGEHITVIKMSNSICVIEGMATIFASRNTEALNSAN